MATVTVLVVEDNPVTLKKVRLALEAEGHRVLVAASGAQALAQLPQRPDLVLLDLGLSDMDGFDLAQRIRRAPEGLDVPLVAFTGRLSASDKARAAAVGFTDFLVKPVEPSRLVGALATWLGRETPPPPAPPRDDPGLDHEHQQRIASQLERQVALNASLWERAIQALPDALLITDARRPGNPVLYVNPAFERITGYEATEVIGREVPLPGEEAGDPEARRALMDALARGRSARAEVEDRRKDGTTFWNSLELTSIRDPSGSLTHFVALMRDVTERRRLEEQLRQAQKMEAVGQLAGGVAHDFNNLLGVITGYGQLLLGELPAGHSGRRRVELMLRAAERAAALTRQLLAFGRKQILKPQVIALDRVVAELEPMLRRLLGEHIQLVALHPARPLHVRADPGQMEQIVMNLAVNARDAMPDGGRLLIEVREVDAGPGADARPEGAAGGSVELSVRDEGTGMTPEVKSRIFEPFFTTKEPGRGTGLGLATVYGIVQQSGGQISVDSEPGRGSRFAISLPRVAPDAPAAAALEPPRGAVGRTGRNAVLLVEDDDLLRELIRELLENAGYQVRAARRPSDALDPAVPGAPVDLLLLDVVLPEMSGPELAARLRQRHPLARVLYMSGYATESVAQHLQAGTPHLKKPFQPAELLERIEEVLKD